MIADTPSGRMVAPFDSAKSLRAVDRIVCPYCVQYRCAVCKSVTWPHCEGFEEYAHIDAGCEPCWADGSTAVLTQDTPCARCEVMLRDYEADRAGDPS